MTYIGKRMACTEQIFEIAYSQRVQRGYWKHITVSSFGEDPIRYIVMKHIIVETENSVDDLTRRI